MFVVLGATTLMLLRSGLAVVDSLVTLTAMTALTMVMTVAGSVGRVVSGFARAVASAMHGPVCVE